MKLVLIILLLSISRLSAQIDDEFISLNNDTSASFNNAFNQKYQLFPQFPNLYQGFLVKPFEREGYYAWLQLKQDGFLKDTIIWVDNSLVQSILKKFPNASSLRPDAQPTDYVLTGRAKMLSFINGRKAIKRISDGSVPSELNDSITIYNNDFAWDYSKFSENITEESWEICYDSLIFKDVSIKGKNLDKLVITRELNSRVLDINKITSLKYSGTSMWLLGTVLGIPAGAFIGGAAGALIETQILGNRGEMAGLAGMLLGGLVGIISGGITGGILFDRINTGPEINLISVDPYDRYFELDRQTFFTLPELNADTSVKVKNIVETYSKKMVTSEEQYLVYDEIADTSIILKNMTDTYSQKLAKSEEQNLVVDEIRRQNELEKPQFSLGGGFFYPLNFNLNLLFYFNDYIGFSYTGFPVPFNENDNQDCSRFGIFYRIHAKKNFFDNVGIHYSLRSKLGYDYNYYPNYNKVKINYSEVGFHYDLSYYGVFFQVGLNYITSQSRNYSINVVSFHFQLGYRYTF